MSDIDRDTENDRFDDAPTVETDRLYLRRMNRGDSDALLSILGDPLTMTHFPRPFDRAMVEAWIDRALGSYGERGFGLYAVLSKTTGELIGDCGFLVQTIGEEQMVELGYHFGRGWWGQGYATEAAGGCIDYAARVLGLRRLVSLIRPSNLQSRRVAEKNGLVATGQADFKGLPHLIYAIDLPSS